MAGPAPHRCRTRTARRRRRPPRAKAGRRAAPRRPLCWASCTRAAARAPARYAAIAPARAARTSPPVSNARRSPPAALRCSRRRPPRAPRHRPAPRWRPAGQPRGPSRHPRRPAPAVKPCGLAPPGAPADEAGENPRPSAEPAPVRASMAARRAASASPANVPPEPRSPRAHRNAAHRPRRDHHAQCSRLRRPSRPPAPPRASRPGTGSYPHSASSAAPAASPVSITRPSSQTSTVRAVMLRWTQPWACSTRRAMRTSEATSAARYGVSGFSASSDRQRPGRHQFTHYPQRAALANTSKTWSSRGWSGIEAAACAASMARRTAGSRGPARGRGPRAAPRARAVPRHEPVGQPVRVEHLRLDDLGQRHLPDQDFLPAVGVEGPGLGRVRTRRTAAAAGGSGRRAPAPHSRPRCLPRPPGWSIPFALRPSVLHAYGPQPLTIRAGGNSQRGDSRSHGLNSDPCAHDFGSNVSVNVCHVSLRSSLPQFDAFAVYISPYPS